MKPSNDYSCTVLDSIIYCVLQSMVDTLISDQHK